MDDARRVLLVEGVTDLHVVQNLWIRRFGAPPPFEIESKDGINNLREAFRANLLASNIARLGIIADADAGLDKRWPGFRQPLIERGYSSVTKLADESGTIVFDPERSVPVIGIWLMPNNRDSGTLEDFVRFLVPAQDSLWEEANHAVDRLPEDRVLFKPVHRSKAILATWLAWQRQPGIPMGQAVSRKLLDAGAPEADALLTWLSKLMISDVA